MRPMRPPNKRPQAGMYGHAKMSSVASVENRAIHLVSEVMKPSTQEVFI